MPGYGDGHHDSTSRVRAALFTVGLAAALAACGAGGGSDGGGNMPDARGAMDGGAVAAGAALVQRYSCPTCHTSTNPADGVLSGQTVAQPGTRAYPANLTPDPTTGLGMWTDDEIVRAIREGVDRNGGMLCVMPVFSQLTDPEARNIVAYLRSLTAVARMIPATQCNSDGGTDARVMTDASDASRPDVVQDVAVPMDVPMDAATDAAMDIATPTDVPRDVPTPMDTGVLADAADAAPTDVVAPTDTGGCVPVLTVNEVQVAGGAGAGDEFVEIYNAATCTASLTGYTLKYSAATSTTETTRWTGTATDTIAGHGYFVVAGMPFTGTAQGRFAGTTGVLAATGGGIGVYDSAGTRLDSVGYGAGTTNGMVEGTPAAAPPSAQSIARQPDGRDTNANAADFHPLTTPTPGAAN